jgi:hypothetical protein
MTAAGLFVHDRRRLFVGRQEVAMNLGDVVPWAVAGVIAGVLAAGIFIAQRRGWVRLRGAGEGSAAIGLAAMEDMF